MADYRQRRWIAAALLIAGLLAGGVWFGLRGGEQLSSPVVPDDNNTARPASPPPPEVSASPFLNTSSRATYVGSGTCVECHEEARRSFLRTSHSRALGAVDPAEEPPDASFRHEKSGRAYRVYRKGGQLRHRETIPDPEGGEVVLGDYPAAYTIGSGEHSRSYLIEVDGFLVESPLTWYASKNAWDLSPGYDRPFHAGFTRPTNEGCIHCHAGRLETVGESYHRLTFHEQKIGCESCHGPGSLHVEFRNSAAVAKGPDRTIVHPGRLSRELNEAVCARCHLRGVATVLVRGRQPDEFRPSLPLTDFRIDYHLDLPDSSMKVTGHFEQMHRSRCYTQSATLTCTTCHNPHDKPQPAQRTAYYRAKCLSCHEADGGCKLPEPDRLARSPQNDCVSCHMPRVGTDIPHFAFTHHRIGLKHNLKYEQPAQTGTTLKPFGDVSRLPALDRDRCLGLGYLESSNLARGRDAAAHRQRAFQLLTRVYEARIRDGEVLAALARLHWERGSARGAELAQEALQTDDLSAGARLNALIVLGDTRLRQGKIKAAKAAFGKLVAMRWNDLDWQKLGECRERDDDLPGAIAAYEKAAAIRPERFDLHQILAQAYARAGKEEPAKKQLELAARLQRLLRARAKPP